MADARHALVAARRYALPAGTWVRKTITTRKIKKMAHHPNQGPPDPTIATLHPKQCTDRDL
jgi:hypothetical protein